MAESPSFDFASRDYATIRRDLLDRASRILPEWTDRDPSDFGVALVDLFAYMGDILHYYIDRAAGEAFIDTATQRESVLALANLYDYTPRFRTAATGSVYVSNSGAASVSIPSGTVMTGTYNGTLYSVYSTSDTTVLADGSATVPVAEGEVITDEVLTSSASGLVGQRYTLSDDTAIPSTVTVTVYEDGVTPTTYTRVTNINTSPSNLAGFSVYPTSTGQVEVVFGGRLSGRVPPSGARITATYSISSGASGNLTADKITSFDGVVDEGLAIYGSSELTGGADSESIESIKRSLQARVRTQERAVTLQDYADYASLVPGVYKAVAAYTPGVGGASVTIYPLPYVSDYTTTTDYSVAVPADTQTAIVDTLDEVKMVGVTVTSQTSVTLNRVDITGTIYIKSQYVASTILTDVTAALTDLFSISNVDFGKEVTLGEAYRTIMSVDGVEYANLTTYEMRDSSNNLISAGSLSPTELLRKGTFTLATSGGITTLV